MASLHGTYTAASVGTVSGNITNIIPFGAFTQVYTASSSSCCIHGNAAEPGRTVSCIYLRTRRHIHTTAIDCGVLCKCAVDVTDIACRIHAAAVCSCSILGDCTVNVTFASGYIHTAAIDCGVLCKCAVDVTDTACRIHAAAVCSCSILGDCTVNVTFASGYIDTAAVNSGILIDHTIYGAGTPCHIDAATVIVISFVFGNIAVDITYTSGHMYTAALSKGVVVTDLCSFLDGTGTVLDIHTAVSGVVVIDVVSADGTGAAKHADCAAIIDTVAGNLGVTVDIAGAAFHHHSAGVFSGRGIIRDFYGTAGNVTGTRSHHDGAGDGTAANIAGAAPYIHRRNPFGVVFDFGGTTDVASATRPCRDGAVDRGSI